MSVRVRRPNRGIRTRLGRLIEGEERQQFVVTALFIAAIVAVALILVGAIALSWYNENLRPLGRVGPVEIGPQLLRDRLNTEQWRIQRERNRLTQAQIDGVVDPETLQLRGAALEQRAQDLGTLGLEGLIDILYQSQLAEQEGITVSDADVDARLAEEVSGIEQRHVLAIAVEPQAADEETGATPSERTTARERAEAALAELESGTPFEDVAREYSTHESAPNGGDLGTVRELVIADTEFASAVFDIDEGGTTEVVRGTDGTYWIGRVAEVIAAPEEPGLRDELLSDLSEQNVRQLLRHEIGAERLQEKVVDEALAQTPEQARISVIYVAGLFSGDPEDAGGEVDYSEIVFAPDNNLIEAPDLPADDPLWAEAEAEASTAFSELSTITDQAQLEVRFEAMATAVSDSPSGEDGGRVGFVTRSIPPTAVGDALFDGGHEEGDLVGPVRGDAGWYVLLFHELRASPEDRLKAVQDALAEPGADFNEVARELSEGPEQADGGQVGWLTRDQLLEDLAEAIFALDVGEISEPLEVDEGHFIVKLEERAQRPFDADQVPAVRDTAFETWYEPKKDAAEDAGTIVRPGADDELLDDEFDPGTDQLLPE